MLHDFTYIKFKAREYLPIMMEMIVVVTVGAAVTGREQVIKFYQVALMIRILFCPYILLKTPSAIHI